MSNNIKIFELKGTLPGKTIVLLAGIHGNEICGVKAFDNLIPSLRIESGRVLLIYANLKAIEENKRFIEMNLNRCFLTEQPEDMKSSLEGRTAREIIPFLNEADAVLDVHASNTQDSIPFIICDKKSLDIASILPGDIATFNWDKFEPGSTDYYMNLSGKPGLCIECGFAKDPSTIAKAEEAILAFLRFFGSIKGEQPAPKKQRLYEIESIYKNKNGPFSRTRYFPDFELLKEKTLIGIDGTMEVYAEKGRIMLFVRDRLGLDEECFLTAIEVDEEDNKYKNVQGVIKS